jgi:hypothetical protein
MDCFDALAHNAESVAFAVAACFPKVEFTPVVLGLTRLYFGHILLISKTYPATAAIMMIAPATQINNARNFRRRPPNVEFGNNNLPRVQFTITILRDRKVLARGLNEDYWTTGQRD